MAADVVNYPLLRYTTTMRRRRHITQLAVALASFLAVLLTPAVRASFQGASATSDHPIHAYDTALERAKSHIRAIDENQPKTHPRCQPLAAKHQQVSSVVPANSASVPRYCFQGREFDKERGDYYFRMRTYVPSWGKFTGPDMFIDIANPMGQGNYVAFKNNGLSFTDPEGLDPEEDTSDMRQVLYDVEEDLFGTSLGDMQLPPTINPFQDLEGEADDLEREIYKKLYGQLFTARLNRLVRAYTKIHGDPPDMFFMQRLREQVKQQIASKYGLEEPGPVIGVVNDMPGGGGPIRRGKKAVKRIAGKAIGSQLAKTPDVSGSVRNATQRAQGKLSRFLRNKAKRINNEVAAGGNRGVSGAVSSEDALRLGKEFVGPGFRTANNGKVLISADGLRQFRLPSAKKGINPATQEPFSKTGIQANFQSRTTASGTFTSNIHLDIIP